MRRLIGTFFLIAAMGLTQWLIDHNIYDPNQPGGQPTESQVAPTPTATSCNG